MLGWECGWLACDWKLFSQGWCGDRCVPGIVGKGDSESYPHVQCRVESQARALDLQTWSLTADPAGDPDGAVLVQGGGGDEKKGEEKTTLGGDVGWRWNWAASEIAGFSPCFGEVQRAEPLPPPPPPENKANDVVI